MKKALMILGGLFAVLFVLYASISALVNQGLPLGAAVVVFLIILLGSFALFWAVRK
jgi:hypothetical protein